MLPFGGIYGEVLVELWFKRDIVEPKCTHIRLTLSHCSEREHALLLYASGRKTAKTEPKMTMGTPNEPDLPPNEPKRYD